MPVNKNHPDYLTYKQKWDDLWSRMNDEIESLPPSAKGNVLDGDPADDIRRKYMKEIKKPQIEYEHLYL